MSGTNELLPGLKHVLLGLLWAGGGALLTWATLQSGSGFAFIFYGAIFGGAIQALIGLVVLVTYLIQVARFKAQHKSQVRASVPLRAMRKSMIAMSVADGLLTKEETEMISRTYKQLSGVTLRAKEIRRLAMEIQQEDASIRDFLAASRSETTDEIKDLIARATILVMVSDGSVSREEAVLLRRVAEGLQIPEKRLQSLLEELLGASLAVQVFETTK